MILEMEISGEPKANLHGEDSRAFADLGCDNCTVLGFDVISNGYYKKNWNRNL